MAVFQRLNTIAHSDRTNIRRIRRIRRAVTLTPNTSCPQPMNSTQCTCTTFPNTTLTAPRQNMTTIKRRIIKQPIIQNRRRRNIIRLPHILRNLRRPTGSVIRLGRNVLMKGSNQAFPNMSLNQMIIIIRPQRKISRVRQLLNLR